MNRTKNVQNGEQWTKFNAVLEEGTDCGFCGQRLKIEYIEMYPHDGGIFVPDRLFKQWVSVKCKKCLYQWSWWKIIKRSGI